MTPNQTSEAVKKYIQESSPIFKKYFAMEKALENIGSGGGCSLHQCGLWANEALSFDPLNENSL